MVRAAGNAPACSCSRSRCLTSRLRSERRSQAHRTRRPAIISTVRGLCRQAGFTWENGRASGYRALYSGLEDRRVSLNTYARKWNPVRESHPPLRFCRPPPVLIGQRDTWRGASRWFPTCSRRVRHLRGGLEPSALHERTKSAITAGTVVSKPTTSSIPRSFGSARVKPLEVIPTTTAFASDTNSSRYRRRACAG